MTQEATARIKIDKLLEEAGWSFFDDKNGPANIYLERDIKFTKNDIDDLGNDFENQTNGRADYLLVDQQKFPIAVIEAKRESIEPLTAKEQARTYATKSNARFIILSNGNIHYLWDLELGNPERISQFPTLDNLENYGEFKPKPKALATEEITENYIAQTQMPNFKDEPRWQDETTRQEFIEEKELKILRDYQVEAIKSLQKSASKGNNRFLFEMATGTGKTLTCAAIIQLFFRTKNARRVLFLVDRLELENQAQDNFEKTLGNEFDSCIYKQHKTDWNDRRIVVTTVQSLQEKYRKLFSPSDFDLIISDEAHRSIGGNARAVFEYFNGYKLGLTATPKDYLKNVSADEITQRDLERRQLLDTYNTFGCTNGDPTFRYSLTDGAKDGYLIMPTVLDARTEITTQLLSDKGYSVLLTTTDDEETEKSFYIKDFERKFFSEKTNYTFCRTFLENALTDPVNGETGKTIIFCVSQKHARKITQVLNKMATKLWPGRYNSDFAVQVTSEIGSKNAQSHTRSFANNRLNDRSRVLEGYKTSKTRVCVTVGMMTTGYDCPDILNLCIMRPIFSPTDFVQIKGRGTRKHNFKFEDTQTQKQTFRLFDFFAVCEYFEEEFDYDGVLELPKPKGEGGGGDGPTIDPKDFENFNPDPLANLQEVEIGCGGMRVDRELYLERAKEEITADAEIAQAMQDDDVNRAEDIVLEKHHDKPELYATPEKIRKKLDIDRPITWKEILELFFGKIPKIKNKEELSDDDFEKFSLTSKSTAELTAKYYFAKNFFSTYLLDGQFRQTIQTGDFANLADNTQFSLGDLKELGPKLRKNIQEYIMTDVDLNKYYYSKDIMG